MYGSCRLPQTRHRPFPLTGLLEGGTYPLECRPSSPILTRPERNRHMRMCPYKTEEPRSCPESSKDVSAATFVADWAAWDLAPGHVGPGPGTRGRRRGVLLRGMWCWPRATTGCQRACTKISRKFSRKKTRKISREKKAETRLWNFGKMAAERRTGNGARSRFGARTRG